MFEFELNGLDLQLFADDADGTTVETDTNDDTGAAADTGSDDEESFGIDENGDLVIFTKSKETSTDESNEQDDSDEGNDDEQDSEKNKPTESEVQKYKVKVDGEEVEVPLGELLNGYMRQSDYTRKTQALAQERNRIKEAIEQPDTAQQQQAAPPTAKSFYENITNAAKDSVSKEIGEEFDEYNPTHIAALAVKVNQFATQMHTHQEKQLAVANFEADARSKEPENYDAIYEYAKDKVDFLPYRERIALEQAFSNGDVKVMNAFFENMRKDYYNSKGMKAPVETGKPKQINKPKPPVVESATGAPDTQIKTRDARALGKMSTDGQAQWLIDMGIV